MEKSIHIPTELKHHVSVEQAWYYHILPVSYSNNVLDLLCATGKDTPALKTELEIVLGKKVQLNTASDSDIVQQLNIHYLRSAATQGTMPDNFRLNVNDDRFLETLVKEAKSLNSSDIHIETYGEKCRIRLRVDGVLTDRHKLNRAEYPTLVNKIKIAASCDIAEKRMPQDGRIRFKFNNASLDIRVSILPTLYGEKIVLRLLGSDASHISIEKLGFSDAEQKRYELAVKKPTGIILISGPTGSGKTTTLYATLKLLNKPTSNILTIEDPIEYTLDGVNQVQLKEEIGLTYTEALRTFLRQDPDVIMLGEIRDAATAQMAIRAALTGHLVLSTIHTNSAWGTVSRLADMGIPPYLLASTLNLSVAQRLFRLLCPQCKSKVKTDAAAFPAHYQQKAPALHYMPVGCAQCHYSGFKGRRAIYEVINITTELGEEIKKNTTSVDHYLQQHNIQKLEANAFQLYTSGQTSLDEIYPYLISSNT